MRGCIFLSTASPRRLTSIPLSSAPDSCRFVIFMMRWLSAASMPSWSAAPMRRWSLTPSGRSIRRAISPPRCNKGACRCGSLRRACNKSLKLCGPHADNLRAAEGGAVEADPLEPVMQPHQIRIAHAAMHLDGGAGDETARLVHMRLGEQGGKRGVLRQVIGGVSRIPDERLAGLQLRRHFGAHMLDRLERADDAAELLALLRIVNGAAEHILARAETLRRQNDAPGVDERAQHRRRLVRERLGRRILKRQFSERAGRIDAREYVLLDARGIAAKEIEVASAVRDDEGGGIRAVEHERCFS